MSDRVLQMVLTFGVLAALFGPLEMCFPQRRQRLFRPEWWRDVFYFLANQMLFSVAAVAVLSKVGLLIEDTPLHALSVLVRPLPFVVQALGALLLGDFMVYWFHRLCHSNAFLWRFHRVHHTARHMDWLAAYREHPVDHVLTRVVENLPLLLFGFPLHLLAGFIVFRGVWAVYIHSNVALDPGPFRYLLGAPRLHHWHHSPSHDACANFGNLNPVFDVLFGTYFDPGVCPNSYGVGQRFSDASEDTATAPPLRSNLQTCSPVAGVLRDECAR